MNHHIVSLSGEMGSGKDTVAKELAYHATGERWYVTKVAFADVLYDYQTQIQYALGVPPEKKRVFLQELGDLLRKEYGQYSLIEIVRRRVERYVTSIDDRQRNIMGDATENGIAHLIIVTDCRIREEVTMFPSSIKVRLKCPEAERKRRSSKNFENETHKTETSLKEVPDSIYDLVFDTDRGDPGAISAEIWEKLRKIEKENGRGF